LCRHAFGSFRPEELFPFQPFCPPDLSGGRLMVTDVHQTRLHAPDFTPHPTGKGPNVSLEAATPPNPEAPPLNPANTARRNENVFAGQRPLHRNGIDAINLKQCWKMSSRLIEKNTEIFNHGPAATCRDGRWHGGWTG
jgi:hypothetical protein